MIIMFHKKFLKISQDAEIYKVSFSGKKEDLKIINDEDLLDIEIIQEPNDELWYGSLFYKNIVYVYVETDEKIFNNIDLDYMPFFMNCLLNKDNINAEAYESIKRGYECICESIYENIISNFKYAILHPNSLKHCFKNIYTLWRQKKILKNSTNFCGKIILQIKQSRKD